VFNRKVSVYLESPPTEYLFFDQKRKMGLVKRIKKQINKFDIKPEDLDFSTS